MEILTSKAEVREKLKKNPQITCVVGLSTEPERLVEIRKNRMSLIKESESTDYTDLEKIKLEVENAKKIYKGVGKRAETSR